MKKPSTIVLGLTGSIGMGKTTTAKMFAKYGIPVWEADTSVHKLYSKEGEAVELFKEKLPSSIVNNEVSRAELKKLINDDERNLKTIETGGNLILKSKHQTMVQLKLLLVLIQLRFLSKL